MRNNPVILLNMAVDIINNRENEVIISNYVQRVSDSGAVPMLIPSLEKEENSLQIEKFLQTHCEFELVEEKLFMPQKNCDGTYAALLIRKKQ